MSQIIYTPTAEDEEVPAPAVAHIVYRIPSNRALLNVEVDGGVVTRVGRHDQNGAPGTWRVDENL